MYRFTLLFGFTFQAFADVIVKTLLTAVLSLMYLWRMFQYSRELTKISLLMVIAAMLAMVSAFLEVNVPAYERCAPILSTLPELEEDTLLPGVLKGDIEVSNVTFSYTPEAGAALKEISLHVKAGEYIGLVGSSGCGKSTLLKLLLGFEKPQQGKVFYDGKDIDSMDKRELRI